MTKTAFLLALIITALASMPAQAQPLRVFVSGHGSDSNPCTVTQPCRTFQVAYNAVAAGGEIDVLDPAGYGPLNINKSIRIEGHGFAGITAPAGANSNAIYINAGITDSVTLRGLILAGNGAALGGIYSQTVGTLVVKDCEVRDFTGTAIFVTGSGTNALVSDTLAANSQYGVYVWPWGSGAQVTLSRVEAHNNQIGIGAQGGSITSGSVFMTIKDSTISNNTNKGVAAEGGAVIYVASSSISNSNVGLVSLSDGILVVSRSTLLIFGDADWYGGVCTAGDNLFSPNLTSFPPSCPYH
jgi:hypothetical protein